MKNPLKELGNIKQPLENLNKEITEILTVMQEQRDLLKEIKEGLDNGNTESSHNEG